ncbi:PREDICTED: pectinesterase 3-like [Tarenaya hassleriana]|uniref:pectinesterase 3-like n=1 Tax=Tarenaya hassleriana TaxID=28532 RepID=UPI00053C52A5|nr:PREDICTED: pectinesterase 3-like [Tarenaya hassleriana]
MKTVVGIIFSAVLLVAAVTAKPPPPKFAEKGEALVAKLCEKSEDKAFCVSSLGSRPDADTATAPELGVIALSIASANASDTSAYIKAKLKTKNLEPALEDTLDDCSTSYLDAVAQLDDSLAALLAYQYTDADIWLNTAISDVETCESALSERDGHDEELERRNTNLSKLVKNALLINIILTP